MWNGPGRTARDVIAALLPRRKTSRMSMTLVLSVLLSALVLFPANGEALAPTLEIRPVPDENGSSTSYCEDFANRQVSLADRLLQQSNYSRAIKVLNRTAENCDREIVRQKLFEVMNAWYESVRSQGSSGQLQNFKSVLSDQSYLSSAQRSKLDQRIEAQVVIMIEEEFRAEDYEGAYRLCRSFMSDTNGSFEVEYYCGRSAEELGASGIAMNSYSWLLQNWEGDQSLATWEETAKKLKNLYFLNARFQAAYELTRRMAARDASPATVLASLMSIRGTLLSPILQVGTTFYERQPSESILATVDDEMQRINFPKYVEAFYIVTSDGSVERGMYGTEANQPSASLLRDVTGSVSLLQSPDSGNLAWLVSPIGSRFLILEFGAATTEEENVRLETLHENVNREEQWEKLYTLEYTETSPASGSAVGTLLSAAHIDGQEFNTYDAIFDDSPILAYYCIQNDSDGIEESYNFDRSNLGYDSDEWERTSTTPALYHHSIDYAGQPAYEVVWPQFVDEKWTGVVRVGLAQS